MWLEPGVLRDAKAEPEGVVVGEEWVQRGGSMNFSLEMAYSSEF